MTVVWRTKLVMSIALFLVKPYRSTTIDLHLRTERDHRRLHGRFYVPPVYVALVYLIATLPAPLVAPCTLWFGAHSFDQKIILLT